jgi:hypothetical protein
VRQVVRLNFVAEAVHGGLVRHRHNTVSVCVCVCMCVCLCMCLCMYVCVRVNMLVINPKESKLVCICCGGPRWHGPGLSVFVCVCARAYVRVCVFLCLYFSILVAKFMTVVLVMCVQSMLTNVRS